jgi:hypothetical protein
MTDCVRFNISSHRGRLAALLACLAVAACASGPGKAAPNARLSKAEELFAERCRASGEKIFHSVDGVDGIVLLKRRPERANYYDQFEMNDPYGNDAGGDRFIETFLRGGYERAAPGSGLHSHIGYQYVDVADGANNRHRYTGSVREVEETSSIIGGGTGKKFKSTAFVLDKVLASEPLPRYGVTYDDISTPGDREYWIAGSSLKVIDLLTGEVMAERVGYMMDIQQGDRAGGRAPWQFAANYACPPFSDGDHGWLSQFGGADKFVEKVLKPNGNKP